MITAESVPVTHFETLAFLEEAFRNVDDFPGLTNADVGDIQRALQRFVAARLATRPTDEKLRSALSAAKGYLMNARIDLETGCTKATAIATINGGIRRIDAALTTGADHGA